MSILRCEGVVGEVLVGLDLELDDGIHVIVGGPADGRDELVRLLSGTMRPRRGRVRVDGTDPRGRPDTRARIGSVWFDEPELYSRDTTLAFVRDALSSKGSRSRAESLLERFGLGALGQRSARSLDGAERRSVAAALAVSEPSPRLICVSEPLARLPSLDLTVWQSALEQVGASGGCVVLVTASADDGARFGTIARSLEHGRIVRRLQLGAAAVPSGSVELVVRAADPRRLVVALVEHADVRAVTWDALGSPDELHVSGADAARLSAAVLEASRSTRIPLRAIYRNHAGLESIQAESAARARAAYEAAYGQRMNTASLPERGSP